MDCEHEWEAWIPVREGDRDIFSYQPKELKGDRVVYVREERTCCKCGAIEQRPYIRPKIDRERKVG